MVNYQLGKIYKIVCNTTGLVYVGSTCDITLARRLSGHRNSYKRFQNGLGKSYMTSFIILENDNYEIVLIENCPCNSSDELHARERHFIEQNECVNKVIPNRTDKEYYKSNREQLLQKQKTYNELNKDKRILRGKNYYTSNIEKIKEYIKLNKVQIKLQKDEYYKANKEKMALQKKEKRQLNKDAMNLKQNLYRELNRDAINLKQKEYREKIKETKTKNT